MKYCTLVQLQPGMTLGQSIFDQRGRLILHAGKSLDEGFIQRLDEMGFSGAYIDMPGFEAVKPPEVLEASLRAGTQTLIDDCFKSLNELSPALLEFDGSLETALQSHPEFQRIIPLGEIQSKANQIVEELTTSFASELPCLLLKAHSQYQVQHAMDTMLIAVIMGINFGFIYRELRQLALAAMLHDVGKALLATKENRTVGPDHPNYKDHPYIGSLIVLESGTNHYNESAAISQHHERQDGKGFPNGLIGFNKPPGPATSYQSGTIYRLAEIISVADAYDVLTSGGCGPPVSPEKAIQAIMKRSFYEFNSHVVNMLARVVQIYPIGSSVRITRSSNHLLVNCRGIVQEANKEKPHQVMLVLTHDSRGQEVKPSTISLVEDNQAQLDLIVPE